MTYKQCVSYREGWLYVLVVNVSIPARCIVPVELPSLRIIDNVKHAVDVQSSSRHISLADLKISL